MKLNIKQINKWNIGFSTYEVKFPQKIPERYRLEESNVKAVCDEDRRKIVVTKRKTESDYTILERLFHELVHVMFFYTSEDIILDLIDSIKKQNEQQKEVVLELLVDQLSKRFLELLKHNNKAIRHILNFLQ